MIILECCRGNFLFCFVVYSFQLLPVGVVIGIGDNSQSSVNRWWLIFGVQIECFALVIVCVFVGGAGIGGVGGVGILSVGSDVGVGGIVIMLDGIGVAHTSSSSLETLLGGVGIMFTGSGVENVTHMKDSLGRNWDKLKETKCEDRRKRVSVRIRAPVRTRKYIFSFIITKNIIIPTNYIMVFTEWRLINSKVVQSQYQSYRNQRWRTPVVPLHQHRTHQLIIINHLFYIIYY